MRHALVSLLVLVAACGDNLDAPMPDGGDTPEPVAAVCDEGQLGAEIAALPNVTSVVKAPCGPYVEGGVTCYRVTMAQPINYAAPQKTFPQHLWLMHRGCDRPTVIADWGYLTSLFYDDELAVLFQANAIWIEHRFQGESIPDPADWDWTQLTIQNGATDMHRVIESFRQLYGQHWVATGASKGGITATYHAYFYPYELDGTIPYVAPASRARLDANYQIYLDSTLQTECAQRIRELQVAALTSRREMMIAHLAAIVGDEQKADYLDGLTAGFDWAFWQYYGQKYCTQVPGADATDDAFWSFFAQFTGGSFDHPAMNEAMSNGALDYEWLTEQGFALQIGAHVKGLLTSPLATATMEDQFRAQFPDVALPVYDGSVTRSVRRWVQMYATNMLLIYGQYDPWSGGALEAPTRPDTGKFFAPAQTHGGAQLATLSDADRPQGLALAEKFFGVPPRLLLMTEASAAASKRDEILARHERRRLLRLP
jgi:hypothetical protein